MDTRPQKGPQPLDWYEGYEAGLRDALWALESVPTQRLDDAISPVVAELRGRLLEMLDRPSARAA